MPNPPHPHPPPFGLSLDVTMFALAAVGIIGNAARSDAAANKNFPGRG